MAREKMSSRELGLILGKALMDSEDLHYGYWDDELELSLANLPTAQQRYTDKLLAALPAASSTRTTRILDIGCGTGHAIAQMLDNGYHADGVIPCDFLASKVRERLESRPTAPTVVFQVPFQDFPAQEFAECYDAAMFSESFQYIPMKKSFEILETILKPGGVVIICDFFKTEARNDGQPGSKSFGGGHSLVAYQQLLKESPFRVKIDKDITEPMSRNIELLDSYLMHRVKPSAEAIGKYLHSHYPVLTAVGKFLFRKRIAKIHYKYLAGHRNKEVFARYKNYRFTVLEKP
ncbi:class I SAM-dependent methyltransferase [Desulfurispira natronophila]|uniref:SAM-dependent methyltransferase n=1 Tax=Desulfurispira natronophila TaxID=682562 RepID=A0A7W7Y3T3_9BACT|nr:class I SAM-dependent methyltransferase [Desulfurispira natronophila]MBB5021560.1 SAM-dependent methyltransferase [Desulfurispira natronophila]